MVFLLLRRSFFDLLILKWSTPIGRRIILPFLVILILLVKLLLCLVFIFCIFYNIRAEAFFKLS